MSKQYKHASRTSDAATASTGTAASAGTAAPHAGVGNAAIAESLKNLRITEAAGTPDGAATTFTGAGGTFAGAAGLEHADEAAKAAKATVIGGERWGDTFEGGRVNLRGGAGDYGLGSLSSDASDGWSSGAGETSAGNSLVLGGPGMVSMQQLDEMIAHGEAVRQASGVCAEMTPEEEAAYVKDQLYGGFDSLEELQKYAEQVMKEAGVTTPTGDDNFSGAPQTAANPLTKHGVGVGTKPRDLAGGKGDGRGIEGHTTGPSGHDDVLIEGRAGGNVDADKHRKHVDTNVAYEAALAANFHTDPKRG